MSGEELENTTDLVEDEFSSIREHFEAGEELTDEEMDKIADLAVSYLRSILALFGETESSIDEYDGENGELILDVNGGDLAVRRPSDGAHLSDEQSNQVLLPDRR